MTDKEFISEIRRGVITIVRAAIKYAVCKGIELAWADFLPKEENMIIAAMAANQTTTRPVEYLTREG